MTLVGLILFFCHTISVIKCLVNIGILIGALILGPTE
jgi:hypothetical protein